MTWVDQQRVEERLGLKWGDLTKEQKDYFGDGTCPDGFPTVEGFRKRFQIPEKVEKEKAPKKGVKK